MLGGGGWVGWRKGVRVSETPGDLERTNMFEEDCRCLTGPEICRLVGLHSLVDSAATDSNYHSMCSPFMHYQVSAA